MKRSLWRIGLMVTCAAVSLFGHATPALAADEDPGEAGDRIQRLEHRLNELAQRQEQLMRRLGAQQERQSPMAGPGREPFRPPMAAEGQEGIGKPMPPAMAPGLEGARAPVGVRPEAAKHLKEIAGFLKLCLLVGLIFNILLAVWIFTDIRKRGEGSGIFIALALLAGIPAAIIYTLARIGDKKASAP